MAQPPRRRTRVATDDAPVDKRPPETFAEFMNRGGGPRPPPEKTKPADDKPPDDEIPDDEIPLPRRPRVPRTISSSTILDNAPDLPTRPNGPAPPSNPTGPALPGPVIASSAVRPPRRRRRTFAGPVVGIG